MGVLSFDYDDDGDLDIFVANDGKPNFLFQNDGKGRFTEQALAAGAACDSYGRAHSNMGVDCGDYNRDGLLDLIDGVRRVADKRLWPEQRTDGIDGQVVLTHVRACGTRHQRKIDAIVDDD